jgi:hypothetical protein
MASAEAKRKEPATTKQIYALRKRGHRVGPGLTKGEAAILFGKTVSRQVIM